jgi:hypothetical protein
MFAEPLWYGPAAVNKPIVEPLVSLPGGRADRERYYDA